MINVIGRENLVMPNGEIDLKVNCDEPRHLDRESPVYSQPIELLKFIPDVEYIEDSRISNALELVGFGHDRVNFRRRVPKIFQ